MSLEQDVRAYSLVQLSLICFLSTSAMWPVSFLNLPPGLSYVLPPLSTHLDPVPL